MPTTKQRLEAQRDNERAEILARHHADIERIERRTVDDLRQHTRRWAPLVALYGLSAVAGAIRLSGRAEASTWSIRAPETAETIPTTQR